MLPRLLVDEPFRVQLVDQHVSDPVDRTSRKSRRMAESGPNAKYSHVRHTVAVGG